MLIDMYDAIDTGQAPLKLAVMSHHALFVLGQTLANTVVSGLGTHPPRAEPNACLVQPAGETLLQLGVVCEVNTVLLHLRAMMSMLAVPVRSTGYRIVWALLWLTFGVFRLIPHGLILWFTTAHFDVCAAVSGAGPVLTGATAVAFALFLAMNVALFNDLYRVWLRENKE